MKSYNRIKNKQKPQGKQPHIGYHIGDELNKTLKNFFFFFMVGAYISIKNKSVKPHSQESATYHCHSWPCRMQDEVYRLIPPDSESLIPVLQPVPVKTELKLTLQQTKSHQQPPISIPNEISSHQQQQQTDSNPFHIISSKSKNPQEKEKRTRKERWGIMVFENPSSKPALSFWDDGGCWKEGRYGDWGIRVSGRDWLTCVRSRLQAI